MRPTKAETTEPKEKKTERAVTKYCLFFGICSRRRVPSVGIDPCGRIRTERAREMGHSLLQSYLAGIIVCRASKMTET